MTTSLLEEYYTGTAVRIDVTIKDYKGDLLDPTTAVITVYDPAGTIMVENATLEKESIGTYYYNLQTSETWVKGNYLVKPKATNQGLTGLVKPYLFKLK